MNQTTRRFPRTLAEAFPDSLEGSLARAEYGAAVTRYRHSDFSVIRAYAPVMSVVFLAGFLAGLWVAR